jgi:glycosyltransferase involved in cell wall biosynthesis
VKIALVGPAHPYKGGGARHTTELAHRLAADGHQVIIESWRAQYPARLYPGQQTVDEADGEPFPRTYRRLAWYRPDGWRRAGRRLRPADLVAFALLTPIQIPAYLTIMAGLDRTVVICHNVLPHERRPGDITLTKALLRRAGRVVVHSREQADLARSLAPRARITVAAMPPHLPKYPDISDISDTAPRRRQSSAAEGCRLLFFGIVRPYKGLDVLLRALAGTPDTITLTVAGEFWGGTAATEKLIAELGIGDRVTLRPGYVPAGEIPALFAAADVLVLPYREATASQNALLAFAHGVPVITTTAGSLADQVRHGFDGLTVAPGDVADLRRALKTVGEPGVLARLAANVRPPDAGSPWRAYLTAIAG